VIPVGGAGPQSGSAKGGSSLEDRGKTSYDIGGKGKQKPAWLSSREKKPHSRRQRETGFELMRSALKERKGSQARAEEREVATRRLGENNEEYGSRRQRGGVPSSATQQLYPVACISYQAMEGGQVLGRRLKDTHRV